MAEPAAPEATASSPSADPIVDIVADVVAHLRTLVDTPDAKLTCGMLVEVIGIKSHVLTTFIFSLLNLLPGPPGYNFIVSLIIIALMVMMIRGHEIRLWGFIGRRQLPVNLLVRLLGILAKLIDLIARLSSPRLVWFTGPAALPVIGIFIVGMGIAMLPPLPFGNMVPSIGVAMVCIGVLNRDGLMVLAGVVTGLVGLAAIVVAIWAIIALFFVVEDVIDGE